MLKFNYSTTDNSSKTIVNNDNYYVFQNIIKKFNTAFTGNEAGSIPVILLF